MVTMPVRRETRVAQHDAESLERAVAFGLRRLDSVRDLALQLDLPSLGEINLPPIVGSAVDQAHLQTVGPLYLASELESALLLPAVETLAGIFASGGLQADIGTARQSLETFWQSRSQRFSQTERQAFFARLFGDGEGPVLATPQGRNTEFESLMIDLAAALYHLEPVPGYGPQPDSEAALQAAASELAANLAPRSGGMAAYAGTELLGAVQAALTILKEPALQSAVGAHSVWSAVHSICQAYLNQEVDVESHVTRGKSGLLVLSWLAGALPSLGGAAGAVSLPDGPVVAAAVAWLQSSLSLGEKQQGAASRSGS